jgi:hypothetical protein
MNPRWEREGIQKVCLEKDMVQIGRQRTCVATQTARINSAINRNPNPNPNSYQAQENDRAQQNDRKQAPDRQHHQAASRHRKGSGHRHGQQRRVGLRLVDVCLALFLVLSEPMNPKALRQKKNKRKNTFSRHKLSSSHDKMKLHRNPEGSKISFSINLIIQSTFWFFHQYM